MKPSVIQEIPDQVSIKMSRADAVALFHSVNRVLSLLDMFVPDLGTRCWEEAPADQAAYDMANEFIAQLQRELQIDPGYEGQAHQPEREDGA
jgi:hypothetical protein